MTTPDRGRGILSKADRYYLSGRKDHKGAQERNRRMTIRDRTRNGLYDFEYLVSDLAETDVSQLAINDGSVDEKVFEAAEDVIAFVFRLCRHAPETEVYSTDDRFREMLRNGIEKGIADDHTILDFKLDLQYGDPREAQGRIQKKLYYGESLSLAELREALTNDYLDDSYSFKPLDVDGLPKYVDPEDTLTEDEY